jgi:1-acyl-sn-glycerol-3-phosphate acyltransferase
VIHALWSLACALALTLYHGLRIVGGALFGMPDRAGGLYDRAPRDWGRQLLRLTGLEVTVRGLERLREGQPYVFASNHASLVDIWVLLTYLPGRLRFIAKRELYRVPLLGAALRATRTIPIDRQHREAAAQAYESAARDVRSGRSVIVFVEGTRTRTGRLQEFKKGGFVLAITAGVPVVPVYLSGTYATLRKGSIRLRRHPITLTIGEPIPTAGLTYDDRERLLERCRQWMLAQQASVDAAAAG